MPSCTRAAFLPACLQSTAYLLAEGLLAASQCSVYVSRLFSLLAGKAVHLQQLLCQS